MTRRKRINFLEMVTDLEKRGSDTLQVQPTTPVPMLQGEETIRRKMRGDAGEKKDARAPSQSHVSGEALTNEQSRSMDPRFSGLKGRRERGGIMSEKGRSPVAKKRD